MQKHVNLVDLVKSFPTNILLQNLASIQKRTSLVKFANLAEKSENGSISDLSTKCVAASRYAGRTNDASEQAAQRAAQMSGQPAAAPSFAAPSLTGGSSLVALVKSELLEPVHQRRLAAISVPARMRHL